MSVASGATDTRFLYKSRTMQLIDEGNGAMVRCNTTNTHAEAEVHPNFKPQRKREPQTALSLVQFSSTGRSNSGPATSHLTPPSFLPSRPSSHSNVPSNTLVPLSPAFHLAMTSVLHMFDVSLTLPILFSDGTETMLRKTQATEQLFRTGRRFAKCDHACPAGRLSLLGSIDAVFQVLSGKARAMNRVPLLPDMLTFVDFPYPFSIQTSPPQFLCNTGLVQTIDDHIQCACHLLCHHVIGPHRAMPPVPQVKTR
jgi:hypothetical protein